MTRLVLALALLISVTAGCGGDDGDDCGPSHCGACVEGCVAIDRCVDGEWQCGCSCDSATASCVSGGESGCDSASPCCSPYDCVGGYCCGGSPPDPHWECR